MEIGGDTSGLEKSLAAVNNYETLRGANFLMKQYGLTAQEAMDYIVRGTQSGLDKTNELGDNLSEYAGKFGQAGYSACCRNRCRTLSSFWAHC